MPRSLDFYLAHRPRDVCRESIFRWHCTVASLAPTVENRIGVEVELLDPFKAISVDPKQFNLEFINRVRTAATVAVGLGLRGPNDR